MNRAPDTRLSEALMRLSPARRKALVGAVSKRFLHEAADSGSVVTTGVPAAPAEAPLDRYKLDEVPTGEVIKDGRGNPAFEKTDAGWKSVIKVPLERILMLVKEANREPVGKLLKDAGEGEVLTILLGFLADPEDANTDKGLRIKKVDGMFMDPVSLTDVKIKEIAELLKYTPPVRKAGVATTAKIELGPDDRVFNNIIFKYVAENTKLKVIVDLDKGGTAQLKLLLGSDEAVSKANEEIAKSPTSEVQFTLTAPTKGSILYKIVSRISFFRPKFRYLPGKRVLVLDIADISQTQWEEITKQLDVGKETKPISSPNEDPIGVTYSDLRSMKAGQIVQQVTIENGAETLAPYGTKFYADFMTIFGKTVSLTDNTFKNTSIKNKFVPLTNDSLEGYNNKIFTATTRAGGSSKVYVHDQQIFQVFSYDKFLEMAEGDVGDKAPLKDDAKFDKKTRTWKDASGNSVTGSITYRITDPEEEI